MSTGAQAGDTENRRFQPVSGTGSEGPGRKGSVSGATGLQNLTDRRFQKGLNTM